MMATFEFELNDSNGVPVEIGDIIEVDFPEVDIHYGPDWDDDYYRPPFTALCRLKMWRSKGLMLKIKRIVSVDFVSVDDPKFDERMLKGLPKPGDMREFRFTTLKWRKVEERE